MYVCMCVRACVYVCICPCVRMCMCVHVCACMYVCAQVYMCACVRVYVCMCVCICVYVYNMLQHHTLIINHQKLKCNELRGLLRGLLRGEKMWMLSETPGAIEGSLHRVEPSPPWM